MEASGPTTKKTMASTKAEAIAEITLRMHSKEKMMEILL
jgi:hypothetical protein